MDAAGGFFLEVVSSFVLSIVVGKPDKEGGSGRTVALAKGVVTTKDAEETV